MLIHQEKAWLLDYVVFLKGIYMEDKRNEVVK